MRVQINLGDDILQKVDEEAKKLGVPRGSMLTTWIGEKLVALEQSRTIIDKIMNNKEIMSVLENQMLKDEKERSESV